MAKRQVWMGEKKMLRQGEYSHYHREVFRSVTTPSFETHSQFDVCHGPFLTVRGAKFAVHCSWVGNPAEIDVDQCERLGREYAEVMDDLPKKLDRRF